MRPVPPAYLDAPTAALARLVDGRPRSGAHAPYRPPTTESGLHLELPGRAVLGEDFVLPYLRETYEVFRAKSGPVLLARLRGSTETPTPADQVNICRQIASSLSTLPDLDPNTEAGRPYTDLRLWASQAKPRDFEAYVKQAVEWARRAADEWRPLVSAEPKRPPFDPKEHKRLQRIREREERDDAYSSWIADYLANRATPGTRVVAADLYALADAENFASSAYFAPGPRSFYVVATERLGALRRGTDGARYFLIPTPQTVTEPAQEAPEMTIAQTIADRAVELAAEHYRDKLIAEQDTRVKRALADGHPAAALQLQRDRLDNVTPIRRTA